MKSQNKATKCVAHLSLTHVPADNTKRVVLDLNIHFAHCAKMFNAYCMLLCVMSLLHNLHNIYANRLCKM